MMIDSTESHFKVMVHSGSCFRALKMPSDLENIILVVDLLQKIPS